MCCPSIQLCHHPLHAASPTILSQVDLIVCWDASASPSRARQRMGRTGRHRPGRVVVLLGRGGEEARYAENLRNEVAIKVGCMGNGGRAAGMPTAFMWPHNLSCLSSCNQMWGNALTCSCMSQNQPMPATTLLMGLGRLPCRM